MTEPAPLTVGMWLGTANQVAKLQHFRTGWKLTDTTTATYRQNEFPDGLYASEQPVPPAERTRRPWPAAPQ